LATEISSVQAFINQAFPTILIVCVSTFTMAIISKEDIGFSSHEPQQTCKTTRKDHIKFVLLISFIKQREKVKRNQERQHWQSFTYISPYVNRDLITW